MVGGLSLVLAGLVAGSVAAPVAPAGAATATPAADPAGGSTTFSFKELGLSQSFSFASGGTTIGIQLPVPAKLRPSVLNGSLIIPPDFGTGSIVVNSGTQFVGSVNLPANADVQQTANFSVSIASVPVVGNYVTLNLVLQQANSGGATTSNSCRGALPLQLIDPTVDYSGALQAPDAIATFFPPVLDKLVLYVPSTPTAAEQTAALDLAAGVASAYQLVPVAISVEPTNGTGLPVLPTGDLVRGIVIRQTGSAGIQLMTEPDGSALLVVDGSASTLPEQATLLSNQVAKLVQTTTATVTKPLASPTVELNPVTFSQLGIGGTTTFSGSSQLAFGVDETALGGVASSMAVTLQAAYTPVESGAKATVQVVVGGVTLASQLLDGSGTLDLPFTIPSALIQRTTNVLVNLQYFPAGFNCASAGRTMNFTIDPRSNIQVTNASGGQGGFPHVPQALIPTFQVAFGDPSATELSAAVQTVAGLQRISTTLLHPTVTPLSTATGNNAPLLLVATSSEIPSSIVPPLSGVGTSAFKVDDADKGQFSMGSKVASLQVFDQTSNNRTVVLATTTGTWALSDSLFAALGNTASTWGNLTGDVAAVGPSGNLVNLTVNAGGPQKFTAAAKSHKKLYEAVAAVVILLIVIAVLWAALRYRRRTVAQPGPDDGG